jgi:uncharacterized protein
MYEEQFMTIKALVLRKLEGLSKHLTYHDINHTLDVVRHSERIAREENITDERKIHLLKVAALFHDSGFLYTYKQHEERSCDIFLEHSEGFDFTQEEKDLITGLIMVTKIPQMPQTLLQQVICDADLDYLGREDFFDIGDNLRKEFLHYNIVESNEEWDRLQHKFLTTHQYHTASSRRDREPYKQANLRQLV